MLMSQLLEIPLRHGSDYIHCYDATGYAAPDHRPMVRDNWTITLHQAPRDLRVLHKAHQATLFRREPETLQRIAKKDETDFTRPATDTYLLRGLISPVRRYFNPRRFTINAGQGAGHWLALYRSPSGTAIPSAGALTGTLMFDAEDDQPVTPAAWALVTAVVTPTVGNPLQFIAQADAHGDFILPLNRMPALAKDAPASTYAAVLTVQIPAQGEEEIENTGEITAIDPDQVIDVDIESFTEAGNFLPSIEFAITPGNTMRIVSRDQPFVVLRQG